MSLFCRSSSVVSGEISLGTAFRPGGQYRHHRCEPWLQPQSGSEHRDSHAHRCAPRDSTADWWKLQTWSFSLPTGSQPDNWTPLHTEIRIPKPAWGHLVSAPTLPHPHHRASHIPPDPTPQLTQVRALNNPQVTVAAERTHGAEGGREGVQVRDARGCVDTRSFFVVQHGQPIVQGEVPEALLFKGQGLAQGQQGREEPEGPHGGHA